MMRRQNTYTFFFIYSIINVMHKKFYASGFLYHLPSGQILLQQDTTSQNSSLQWFLFGKPHVEKDVPAKVFKDTINDLLDINIDMVLPVYSYETDNTHQSIIYAELEDLKEFPSKNGLIFNWFSFKSILKLQITPQTKHDIVVGQRVIEATGRKNRGEHTFQ